MNWPGLAQLALIVGREKKNTRRGETNKIDMKVEGGRGVVVQGEGGLKTVKQIGRKQTSSRPRTKTHQTSRYPHHFTFPIFYFIFFFASRTSEASRHCQSPLPGVNYIAIAPHFHSTAK